MYPPEKRLPSALQKCLFTEAPGGEPATLTRSEERAWWVVTHPSTYCSALSWSDRAFSEKNGAVASGSFACATAFLPRALGKAKLPANILWDDSHLSALRTETSSHKVTMPQSAEIPQW